MSTPRATTNTSRGRAMTSGENNGTAVARVEQPKPPVPLSGPIADLDSAYRYASALAQADLMPSSLRGKPSNVLAIILYGQYLNVPPMVAIQSISVVNGRPQIEGKLLVAKVREAGHRLTVSDHTAKSCTVTIARGDNDEQHSETFTWEDAELAKLAGKDTYKQHPKRMLLWRAVAHCVDIICPEIKMGFGVEGEEYGQEPERPTLAQAVAQRTSPEPQPETAAPATETARDDAIEAEILDLQAEHAGTAAPAADLPDDDAMAAEVAAYEAEQAAKAAGGQE